MTLDGQHADKKHNTYKLGQLDTSNTLQNSAIDLVGRRLEIVVERVGRDISVLLTRKSWKQIRRYFDGADVPVSVIRALAGAAGVSSDFIVDGRIHSALDAEVAQALTEQDLARVRMQITACTVADEVQTLQGHEARLKRMLREFTVRRNEYLGREETRQLGPASVDATILARLMSEAIDIARRRNIRIPLLRQAEIVAAHYAEIVGISDDSTERRGAMKIVLRQIERDLLAAGDASAPGDNPA